MEAGTLVPGWLHILAILSLVLAALSAVVIAIDLARHPQHMAVMNAVWPITALYFGPVAVWAYWAMGRPQAHDVMQHGGDRGQDHKPPEKPFWQKVSVGVTHCGAGCTLGDIIAEFTVFFAGLALFGSTFGAELAGDYILAYLLGIVFQYFAIVPMRKLSPGAGIWAAIKADTLSLTAFEIGLFGWMVLMRYVFFTPPLKPDQPVYWFMMQIGMILGFATSYPVNWWLIRSGIKEAM